METVRRALLAVVAMLAATVPAYAQDAAAAAPSNGNFIFIWVWILIAGVIIFIVGTSMGVQSGK